MNVTPGMLVRVKPNVSWKGNDIGRKEAKVVDTQSYVLVDIAGFNERIKLLRTEIDYIITDPEFDDVEDYLNGDLFDYHGFFHDD